MLFGLIKKLFSSLLSALLFLFIIGAAIKYQLYNPSNWDQFIDKGHKIINAIEMKFGFGGSENKSDFVMSDYGIEVETIPRGLPKYLVVLIDNVSDKTDIEKVVNIVKVLDTPVVIGLNGLSSDKLSTLTSELSGYKVSYALDIPEEDIDSYDNVKEYVTSKLVDYGSIVNINTIVVNTVSEGVSRYAVLNNLAVITQSDTVGMGKLRVGGEKTNHYYFKSLYYADTQEDDAPVIKEKIRKILQDKKGVIIIGFDASNLSSDTSNNDEDSDKVVTKSRLVQDAIISPIVDVYYNSGFKFYSDAFDNYIDFLSDVAKVAEYFSESNAIINSDEYGTKIQVPMGHYPAFVTIKIPKEIGLIKTQKLASVNLYNMDSTKVSADKYYKSEVGDDVIIYPLEDLKDVKLVITYVTPAGD